MVLGLQVAEGHLFVDFVDVPSADASPFQVARVHEVPDDPLDCPLGDAKAVTDVGHADAGILRDDQEDQKVAGDERPVALGALRGWHVVGTLYWSATTAYGGAPVSTRVFTTWEKRAEVPDASIK